MKYVCRSCAGAVAVALLLAPGARLPGTEDAAGAAPADVLGTIRVPDGFTVELAAGPPLVERPMLASFDDAGRLYVADSAGVNLRGEELLKNPPHTIRCLEDTDGDGRFDRSHVFADRLVFPQGILWHDGAVHVSSPPSFWRLRDTDGDGAADERLELATGFANTGVADDMHGASLGPDGRVYWFAGRFPHEIRRPGGPPVHKGTAPLLLRARADGSDLEVVCGTQGNGVGVAFTVEGDAFASGTFLAPDSMGAGLRDALIHCVDGGEYPVRDRVLDEHRRTGDLLPPLAHLGVAAASDLTIYRGAAFGPAYRGNLFSALFNMHRVARHLLEREGATYNCRTEDFLVSSHDDFHPTDVLEDADGSLLVADTGGWFRIGCPTSRLAKPEVLGAIYRVRRQGAAPPADPHGLAVKWKGAAAAELAALLDDPRPAVRDRALAELARAGPAAAGALRRVLASGAAALARANAVWALSRLEGDEARDAVRLALGDGDDGVRQAAARAAGIHRDARAAARLAELVREGPLPVRREAATALGRLRARDAVPALLAGLRGCEDRFLEHALIFALIQIADPAAARRGLEENDPAARAGAIIALDQMDGGGLTPGDVFPYLAGGDDKLRAAAAFVLERHPEWGGEAAGLFEKRLAAEVPDAARAGDLTRQLAAFAGDAAVQDLIARRLAAEETPAATLVLILEAVALAPLAKVPPAWGDGLRRCLSHPDLRVARTAVAAARALPPDPLPALARIDAPLAFESGEGKFAGTELSDHFAARWTGLIRVPAAGAYRFALESDDGSRLAIGGRVVVANGGFHAMREKSGVVELAGGEHEIRVDYFQGGGSHGLRLLWERGGTKEVVPREVLFHRRPAAGGAADSAPNSERRLEPGLLGEYFRIGGALDGFPDLTVTDLSGPLLALARDAGRPAPLRVEALAALAPRLDGPLEEPLFRFLAGALDPDAEPLLRATAAETLGRAPLGEESLQALAATVAVAGPLELPRLLPAFERGAGAAAARALVAALERSPGAAGLPAETLERLLGTFPPDVQESALPLVARAAAEREARKARLAELLPQLASGEVQEGREVFFGKRAACSACHAVQGRGGRFGPDLTKIGAIRSGPDLLEAVLFPSASFARGYEPYAVATRAGEVYSGIILRETAGEIHLVINATTQTRILRTAIAALQAASVSIMPEGLDRELSRRELGDLLAFLASLK